MVKELSTPSGAPSCTESLVARCQQGDPDALNDLVATYRDTVYAIALHFLGNETLAADVTQEVFLKVLNRVRQFRREAQFTSWLYRIVVNTCLTQRKREQRFVALDELLEGPVFVGEACQENEAMRRQAQAALRSAVLRLSPGLRLAVLLRYGAGLSYKEIGRLLRVPGGTVASRLGRAHRTLHESVAHLRGAVAKVKVP